MVSPLLSSTMVCFLWCRDGVDKKTSVTMATTLLDEEAKLMAAQIEEERRLKRKRDREIEEAKSNPMMAMMADVDEGDENEEKWVSIKQKKEQRAETVKTLKKKIRGEDVNEENEDKDEEAEMRRREEEMSAAQVIYIK
jgi:hypothetical protein